MAQTYEASYEDRNRYFNHVRDWSSKHMESARRPKRRMDQSQPLTPDEARAQAQENARAYREWTSKR